MSRYTLRFVNPANSSEFIGTDVETEIKPEEKDPHVINNKTYYVTSVQFIETEDGHIAHCRIRPKPEEPDIKMFG